jgi:hypothetical protein
MAGVLYRQFGRKRNETSVVAVLLPIVPLACPTLEPSKAAAIFAIDYRLLLAFRVLRG